MPRAGWTTVTIPGAVSGWIALSKRFGKLPFTDLFGPAIRYARDGYAVSPVVGEKWAKAVPILGNVPGFAEHFLPRGRAPHRAGSSLRRPRWRDHGSIARTGGVRSIAATWRVMVAHSRQHDGGHSLADFEAHTCSG
jgi:gamma-glutamyltranspeptidase/glutathione hydrolase